MAAAGVAAGRDAAAGRADGDPTTLVVVPLGLVVAVDVVLTTVVVVVVVEGTTDVVVVVVRATVVVVLDLTVVVVVFAGRRSVVVVGAIVVLVTGTTTPGTKTGGGTGRGRTSMYVASAARKIPSEIQVESRTRFTRRFPHRWSSPWGRQHLFRLGARRS